MIGKNITSGKVEAIFGLDPAGPGFSEENPRERLAATDAKYVEVLHTDAYQEASLGGRFPMGQADFCANFGGPQPGCSILNNSHKKAVTYFAQAINGPGYEAKQYSHWEDILAKKQPDCSFTCTYKPEPPSMERKGFYNFMTRDDDTILS
jgi:Lipase